MKYTDPLDDSKNLYVDSLIDQAIDRERHLHEVGRRLKDRVRVALEGEEVESEEHLDPVTQSTKFSPETNFEGR